jgi:hypothetical protein
MTSDFFHNIPGGLLRFNSYTEIIENLYLAAIIDSFERLKTVSGIAGLPENKIRNHLVFDLENDNDLLRPFLETKTLKLTKENTLLLSPNETKRTDFEFFISGHGDFVVECKNLASAEKRYIDKGIKRFTEEYYAKKDDRAAMIGFVISNDINKLITRLNKKVQDESSFIKIPSLEDLCIGYEYSFHSSHKRLSRADIILYHLFVMLN